MSKGGVDMMYRPQVIGSYCHPNIEMAFANMLARLSSHAYREFTIPYLRGLEQHDRVVALIAEFGAQDTAQMRKMWRAWRKSGELTVDTILRHLIRDGKLTRYMGGYSGMCASWHYQLPYPV